MTHTHDWLDIGTRILAVCSLLHTFLPPWEAFNDFPTLQKYYKLLVYCIGYAAGNGRSTVYRSISTKDGTQTSPAASQNGGGQ